MRSGVTNDYYLNRLAVHCRYGPKNFIYQKFRIKFINNFGNLTFQTQQSWCLRSTIDDNYNMWVMGGMSMHDHSTSTDETFIVDLKYPCNRNFIAYRGPRLLWRRTMPSVVYVRPYVYVIGGTLNVDIDTPKHHVLRSMERIDTTDF